MMRECPCSTKTRVGLENPSPLPSRFPLAMGFASLDPRDFPRASPSGNPSGLGVQNPWPREISRDFPRPLRFLGSREILGVGDGFSNPSLLLVEHGYSPFQKILYCRLIRHSCKICFGLKELSVSASSTRCCPQREIFWPGETSPTSHPWIIWRIQDFSEPYFSEPLIFQEKLS